MLFAALTNYVCLNNASLFFLIFFYDRAMSSPEKYHLKKKPQKNKPLLHLKKKKENFISTTCYIFISIHL